MDLTPVIGLAIQELPSIISLIKGIHATQNPDAPALTDEDVIAALNAAIASSVAKDDQWLAAHSAS